MLDSLRMSYLRKEGSIWRPSMPPRLLRSSMNACHATCWSAALATTSTPACDRPPVSSSPNPSRMRVAVTPTSVAPVAPAPQCRLRPAGCAGSARRPRRAAGHRSHPSSRMRRHRRRQPGVRCHRATRHPLPRRHGAAWTGCPIVLANARGTRSPARSTPAVRPEANRPAEEAPGCRVRFTDVVTARPVGGRRRALRPGRGRRSSERQCCWWPRGW